MSLTHFGLDGVFDAVEVGSPQGVVKAAAIARVVERWGVAARDVIYVGDAVADMEAARRGGRAADRRGVGAECDSRTSWRRPKPHALFTDAGAFRSWLAEVFTVLDGSVACREDGLGRLGV